MSDAGVLAGEDPVDPETFPKPVDPAFYLSYPPVVSPEMMTEEEQGQAAGQAALRRPRRESCR